MLDYIWHVFDVFCGEQIIDLINGQLLALVENE